MKRKIIQYLSFLSALFVFALFLSFTIHNTKMKTQNLLSDSLFEDSTQITYGKVFFEFDKIEYFRYVQGEVGLGALERKISEQDQQALASLDSLANEVIFNFDQSKKMNVKIYNNLTNIGFEKNNLPDSAFTQINKILLEKRCKYYTEIYHPCMPIFRDILVFIKDKKIVGYVKVCFTCDQINIVGSSANILLFNTCESDFVLLSKVLKQ